MWKKLYLWLILAGKFLSHFVLLLIRLYWGALLIILGLEKYLSPSENTAYFRSLDIPYPLFFVLLVGLFEFFGGLSFLFGLFARLFAIPLIVIFLSAYFTAHYSAVIHFFDEPSLFIAKEPFLYLYAALILFCFGSGWFSFDYWREKKAYSNSR